MDSNFRRDGPGKSPMGMDLVPVYEGQDAGGDPAEVELSGTEVNAIGVRTAVARVEPLSQTIETVGFVRYNEHLTSHVHTRVEGWIEDLSVRAVGDRVAEGDLLFTIYAPEIRIASAEFIRAVRRRDSADIEITRRKLRNYDVSEAEIDEMIKTKEPVDYFGVYAPRNGVVTALAAADGMFLKPDVRAMTISDLSEVWLLADIFERDIGKLSSRKTAKAQFEHLPGQAFEGVIDYIYPELDKTTRTLPIRLNFDNSAGTLRPNMYGQVQLVSDHARDAITVPTEAVIRTGRAERVILKTGNGTFKPRLVTTGLADSFGTGGRTEVVQGLLPGDEVVASAQFLLDSESALNAGIMRMAPTDEEPAAGNGTLVSLDPDRRIAEISHEPIASLDWPAMTTRFALAGSASLDRLVAGDTIKFSVLRGADGLLALHELKSDDGIDATGTGVVHAVTDEGLLSLSHDPIPSLGWPAMQMDMPVVGVKTADIPLGKDVSFDLVKGEDGLFTVVAVRKVGADDTEPKEEQDAGEDPGPKTKPKIKLMSTNGTINAVDAERRMANVSHGPLMEIGMPGMTMDFKLAESLDASEVPIGPATVAIGIDEGGTMLLVTVEAEKPPMKATGTINKIDPENRIANITHGPLADVGMPGMTMDFEIDEGIDAQSLPQQVQIELHLKQNPDFTFTLIGFAEVGS